MSGGACAIALFIPAWLILSVLVANMGVLLNGARTDIRAAMLAGEWDSQLVLLSFQDVLNM